MLSFGGLSIHYSNPQRLFFPDLVKRVSVASRKPRRFVCCTHLIKRHFYICFLVGLQIPNWDRVDSFSNKKESKTRASTSLHVYFMLSDSCTVFLHLYKSIFLPLPSRSPEQCSLWLSGSIKVCQMNRKNHAWRGNEKLSKATWNLKHFFSFSLSFFFFFPLFIWRARLAMYKPQGLPLSGCATPVFCFVARLTCFQNRGERRWMSTRQRSKARTPRVSVEWREFGVFFVFLRLGKVFKPLSVHGFVNKLEIIVHSVTLTPQRNVIESSLFPFKRPLRAKCAHVQTSVTIFPT